ncbi:MAG: hypothetical protein M3Z82_01750 [Apilactobacillus sp.]|uniref:hypothetical protein n=1 Tax=Apilactobacillus apinorum TaxID=1218495 RepID=UPI0030EADA63|nr:hypothetical protein [Apilactobacillus sp.]
MNTNLVVDGDQDRIKALVECMLFIDYPVHLTILNHNMDDFISNIKSRLLCENFDVAIDDDNVDYHDFDGFMYLYPFPEDDLKDKEEVVNFLSPYLDQFRTSLNLAIKGGFSGKILINGYYDEILNYFATKFSGKEPNTVISTGLLGKTLLLKHLLRRYFNISLSDINVSVVGNQSTNLITWSRAYIGQSPILSYLANPNNLFSTEIFAKAEEILSQNHFDEVVQMKAILMILDAIFMEKPCLASVGHVVNLNDDVTAVSEPVMLNHTGMVSTVELVLSDKENQVYLESKQEVIDIINLIVEGSREQDE